MANFTIYLSSIEPTTIENETISSVSTEDDNFIIPMLPLSSSNSNINIEILLRKIEDNYIDAVFGPGSPYLSWERTYIEFENSDTVSPESSITIEFKNPVNDRQVEPYWGNSTVSAKNPDEINNHYPYIVKKFFTPDFNLGEIPESSSDIWERNVPETYIHVETQPIVRPGEYLALDWELKINENTFKSITMVCPYDTPLFTGGWILSKTGDGIDVKYTVEIFGEIVTDIIPTDFYDYTVGKWVYLMKDVTLTLDPLKCNKQMYSSSGITDVDTSNLALIFSYTNEARQENGLDLLVSNSTLQAAAQSHAEDMAANSFVSHYSSDSTSPTDRLMASGYLDDLTTNLYGLGENVAASENASDTFDWWMNSSQHKANILYDDFVEIGIGVALGVDGRYYYVQDFGYREDKTAEGIASYTGKYRIVPFNFKGPMNTSCAVPFEDSIELDSATNFEKVFDMISYTATISNIDYENDTATITIPDINNGASSVAVESVKDDVPIFYYCDGSITDVAGGAGAFDEGDQVIVESPEKENLDLAKIIGFVGEIKECSTDLVYFRIGAKYLIWNTLTQQAEDLTPYNNPGTYEDMVAAGFNIANASEGSRYISSNFLYSGESLVVTASTNYQYLCDTYYSDTQTDALTNSYVDAAMDLTATAIMEVYSTCTMEEQFLTSFVSTNYRTSTELYLTASFYCNGVRKITGHRTEIARKSIYDRYIVNHVFYGGYTTTLDTDITRKYFPIGEPCISETILNVTRDATGVTPSVSVEFTLVQDKVLSDCVNSFQAAYSNGKTIYYQVYIDQRDNRIWSARSETYTTTSESIGFDDAILGDPVIGDPIWEVRSSTWNKSNDPDEDISERNPFNDTDIRTLSNLLVSMLEDLEDDFTEDNFQAGFL